MKISFLPSLLSICLIIFVSCSGNTSSLGQSKAPNTTENDSLPPPYATKSSVNFSKVVGWPKDVTPKAPEGFSVNLFAGGFKQSKVDICSA
jgi:hypothetical protein